MTSDSAQADLFEKPDSVTLVTAFMSEVMNSKRRPSGKELVLDARAQLGDEAAWQLPSVVAGFAHHSDLPRSDRDYCRNLLEADNLIAALRTTETCRPDITSTIDELIGQSQQYRQSPAFKETIDFMARFRDYAPYNNMLVKIQNPSCGFYATARDWRARFKRRLREDARPMLILAPMHPVMLVYDIDQTEGDPIPDELAKFGKFSGDFRDEWLSRSIANAEKYRIRIGFRTLSSTHGGFATLARVSDGAKMRVVIHDRLDDPSRFGILSHELAHILLGHLGSDWDHWWPARANLSAKTMEVEAEAVAFIVTQRFGLEGSSAEYVSRHLNGGEIPEGVSLDLIAKTAGLLERMARETMPAPKPRPFPKKASGS